MIVVASLMGNQLETIKVDKLLHFGGYAMLAMIFILGLRPVLYLPALLLLALLSVTIEYIQPFNARSFDPSDMLANITGLATGFALGLVLRVASRMVQTQRLQHRLQRARRRFSPGAIIVQQGAAINKCYLIEKGEVQLSREVVGQRHILGRLGPGEMFSILGLLQAQPQYATVEAIKDTTVISLGMADLHGTPLSPNDPLHAVLIALSKQMRAMADRIIEVEKVVP